MTSDNHTVVGLKAIRGTTPDNATTHSDVSLEQFLSFRDELLERKAALERELIPASRRFNASRPVNRLPVELLIIIFCYLQVRDGGYYDERWYYRVAAVCKYWHDVASDCLVLWRHIMLDDSYSIFGSTDVFLARTVIPRMRAWRGVPKFSDNALGDPSKRLMDVQYRPHDLEVCSEKGGLRRVLEASASLVEVLEVDCEREDEPRKRRARGPWDDEDEEDEEAVKHHYREALRLPVDPTLFPNLCSFTLTTAAFAPQPVPLPSLRRLRLSNCMEMQTTIDELLVFISGCQTLEELTLHLFRPNDDKLPSPLTPESLKQTPPVTPVLLPATLRKVSITDFAPYTARLLQGMAIPSGAELSIELTSTTGSPLSDWPPDWPLHTAFPSVKFHIGVFYFVHAVCVKLNSWTYNITGFACGGFNNKVSVTTKIGDSLGCEYLPKFLADLTELFRESPVTDLTINAAGEAEEELYEDEWDKLFEALPCLERLRIVMDIYAITGNTDSIATMLSVLGGAYVFDDDAELPCPALKSLTLYFRDKQVEADVTPGLEDCLKKRKDRGVPVAELCILLHREAEPDADLAVLKQSALKRYRKAFQPYVKTIKCGFGAP
ncbi:hypothetical protein C8Q70DRAFT_935884 [Cubamyces menziesii]|nr:hypothetical protein C8Q70DRAFT_935884 [Cubamyces menziesii]